MTKEQTLLSLFGSILTLAYLHGPTANGQTMPETFVLPTQSVCASPPDQDPDVKFYYRIDGDHVLTFFAILPFNTDFQRMEMALLDLTNPWADLMPSEPADLNTSDLASDEVFSMPPDSVHLYWSQTGSSDEAMLWEFRPCGNVSHRAYDNFASLDVAENVLTVVQSRIEWNFNTCRGEFQMEPDIESRTGIFRCEFIDRLP